MSRFFEWIKRAQRDFWRVPSRSLSCFMAFWLNLTRIVAVTWCEFWSDRVTLRASAMTFYTLLSVVPLATLGIALAGRFELDDELIQALYDAFPEQKNVLDQIFFLARHFVERASSRVITLSGLAIALWSIIKVLMHMDRSFSDIWGVQRARVWWRRVVDYLILLLACPVILMLASSLNILLNHELEWLRAQENPLQYVSSIVVVLILLLPWLLISGLLTFLYLFVPNTRVRFVSGLTGGMVAGAIYQVVQWYYIRFQSSVSHYDAIYGSLAALPLFLIWLEVSWIIVLMGAEISYAFQNIERYEFKRDLETVPPHIRRALSIYLLAFALERAGGRSSIVDLARGADVPLSAVQSMVRTWVKVGIAEWEEERRERFQLVAEVHEWHIKEAVDRLEMYGSTDTFPLPNTPGFRKLVDELHSISDFLETSSANRRLADLLL